MVSFVMKRIRDQLIMLNYLIDPIMKKDINQHFPNKRLLVLFIALISLMMTLGGYWYYSHEKEKIQQAKENTLSAIARLKTDRIAKWYKDELQDAQLIASHPFLIETISKYIETSSETDKNNLSDFLNQIKAEHDFHEVFITSSGGDLIASGHNQMDQISATEIEAVKQAIATGKGVSSGLFQTVLHGEESIYISYISTLSIAGSGQLFAIVCRMDPNVTLYPLIESWPIPSLTAETFLFSVVADSVLYLNNLRHKSGAALKLKIPLSQSTLPAAKASTGFRGIVSGKDYRNVDVVAYTGKIDGTQWYIVSKIDKSEMYAEMPLIMIRIAAFVLIGILLAGLGVWLIYNQRQKSIYLELYQKEKEIWQQQEKFKVTMDSLGDGVIVTDTNAKIQYMNSMAEKLTDWKLREARGRSLGEVYAAKNEETGEKENNILDKVMNQGIVKELANHTILLSRSGKEIPIMDTGAPIYDSDGTVLGIVITFQDETEKRKQQRFIKESEDRFRSSLDNLIEGCQIIGYDYTYLYLNKAAIESSRKPKEELIGKTMTECYPGIENTEMFSVLKKCMELRVPEQIENEFTYPDGDKGVFDIRFEPVPDGVFILSDDITEMKKFETELTEKSTILESFFDNTLTLIALLDKDFNFIRVNQAYAAADEKDVDFFVGKYHFDLYPSEAHKIFEEVVRSKTAYQTMERPFTYERNPQRGVTYWDWSLVPLLNSRDEVDSLILTLLNVTERIKAKAELVENEKFLSTMFNSVNDAIFTISMPDRTIQSANKAVSDLFGYDTHEVIGKQTRIFYPVEEPYIEYGKQLSLAIREDKPFVREELTLQKKDGQLIHCEVQATILKQAGENDIVISVLRDITQRKEMIDEIIHAKEKAEASDKLKTAFINNISHEIRTPLNGILGFGQFLVSSELTDYEREEYYAHVEQSSNRLMNTVTDYMDMAMIFSGTKEIHRKDMVFHPFFEKLIDSFRPRCETKGITLKIELPENLSGQVLYTDYEFIKKIYTILFENALKFTEKGSISCGYRIIPGFVEFFVTDTGKGIDSDKFELIFEMFAQEDVSNTRGHEGSGLGLTIAKGLVSLLGGTIAVVSEKGKGSTFTFTIPIDREGTIETQKSKPEVTQKANDITTILVAEDDESNYLYLKTILDTIGFPHIHAANGSEAIEKCQQNPEINLILMDIKMPVMNGIEATKQIRKFKPDIPIIAITAYAQTGDEHLFIEAGCNDYLAKPLRKDRLIKLLNKNSAIPSSVVNKHS